MLPALIPAQRLLLYMHLTLVKKRFDDVDDIHVSPVKAKLLRK